ncbi:MAG: biopolymer transporter ExbD [Bdellovibrionales bacterium]|jgi:biopolymer transport protein ExbD
MAIFVPGKRNRHGKKAGGKRSVVAALSLTAMVDLFTVLVVFLLQNYATTGEVLDIPEGVKLPDASVVKDLKPANVIIVSEKEIKFNNEFVQTFDQVKAQEDWEIASLKSKIELSIQKGEEGKKEIATQLKSAVEKIKAGDLAVEDEIDSFRKITIQADRQVDFLTLKKVMYTATESGIIEINFAVLKAANTKSELK